MEVGRFRDRHEAGVTLAEMLAPVASRPCVVVAIPRGGVVLGVPVAERLSAPLTVAYARKLTAPLAPELAFGAVDEDGEVLLDDAGVEALGLGLAEIDQAKAGVGAEITRRMALYRVPPLAYYLPGSVTVVLVDDGLDTGLTMRAAVAYARRHGAREIIVAAPCASTAAAECFQREADRFVCPIVDKGFMAVAQYYADFPPVTDDEVVSMLEEAGRGGGRAGARRLSFRSSKGLTLAAELLLPDARPPHPVIVFAHGWGSGKASPRNRAVAEGLRAAGFAAVLFDFTGHGESEGTPADSTPEQQVEDLDAAIGALQGVEGVDVERVGVVGASAGGAVALVRAAVDKRIRAMVLRSTNPAGTGDAADRVTVPTLLVVGERDEPIRAANDELLGHLVAPARLEVVPRGDHVFEDPEALRRVVAVTVDWFAEHLGREGGTSQRGRRGEVVARHGKAGAVMDDWNVVVTVREHGYQRVREWLGRFGRVGRTSFRGVLALKVEDIPAFLERLRTDLEAKPELRERLGHVMPVTATFAFQTPEEFEARAREAVGESVPALAGKRFHVRMHRRGFKGRLSSPEEERFLDGFLLERLQSAGQPGEITFDDPDAILAVETIGQRAGVSVWRRDDLERYPFLRLD
jgi:putative phosphoribosyl transferase